jgi:hypothetical protein
LHGPCGTNLPPPAGVTMTHTDVPWPDAVMVPEIVSDLPTE